MAKLIFLLIAVAFLSWNPASAQVEVVPYTYPWTVRISSLFQDAVPIRCAATLIAPSWVITARSCVVSFENQEVASSVTLVFGKHDINDDEEIDVVQIRTIDDQDAIFFHPLYNASAPTMLNFALLRLSEPVELTPSVSPIALPGDDLCTQNYGINTASVDGCVNAVALGWGRTGANADAAGILKITRALPIRPYADCEAAGSPFSASRICAGNRADACPGDVGAPLMCALNANPRNTFLLGVVTHVTIAGTCLPETSPSVHARICAVTGWIRTTARGFSFSGQANPVQVDPVPTPTIRVCGALPSLANGRYSEGSNEVGSFRSIICNSGFNYNGDDDVTICQEDLSWTAVGQCVLVATAPPPTAAPVPSQCGLLPSLANGRYEAGGFSVGDRRNIICNAGFVYNQNDAATLCQSNLNWRPIGSCVPVPTPEPARPTPAATILQCGPLPVLLNGRLGDGNFGIGTYRDIICNAGFRYEGDDDVTFCQSDLTWSPVGRCVAVVSATVTPAVVRCTGALPVVRNGQYIAGGDNVVGSQRAFTCSAGFQLSGFGNVVCQSNGAWSAPGSCEPISCGPLPAFPNGAIGSGGSVSGSTRTISCNAGFSASRAIGTITCQASGLWTAVPTCQPIAPTICGALPAVANGFLTGGDSVVGSTRNVRCNAGFRFGTGAASITCRADGTWSSPGSCVEVTCPAVLPDVSNGGARNGAVSVGSKRQVICNSGYALSSNSDAAFTCESNGVWSGSARCVMTSCGEPELPNAVVSPGATNFGAVRTYACLEGFQLSADAPTVIRCQNNGAWSNAGVCIRTTCALRENTFRIVNGYIGDGGNNFGAIRFVRCNAGYEPAIKGAAIKCLENGGWTRPPAGCVPSCGDPNVKMATISAGNTTVGSVRSISCTEPAVGNFKITCQANGLWSTGECSVPPATSAKRDDIHEPGVIIAIILVVIIALAGVIIGIWLCCVNRDTA